MADVVCVKTFSDRIEAEMAKSIVEQNGVNAYLLADDAGGMLPQLAFSQGIRLLVRNEDRDKALELLKGIENR